MVRDAMSTESARGEAGRTGPSVRSDAHLVATLRDSGGVDVRVKSKVGAMFGESIRKTVEDVAAGLKVEHAVIEVDDRGALPFVLAARAEAAIRAAGWQDGDGRPRQSLESVPTARDRMRRSRLYLPGNEPKFMVNAGLHRPDAVILDLEDSVHPDAKSAARVMVRNALRCVDFMGAERMVRINQLPLGLEDLDAIVPEAPDLVLIPKVETAEQVRQVHERIEAILEDVGSERPVWLMPILESALGVVNTHAIATAADSIVALTIGLEDYSADLGVPKTKEGAESLYARSRLANSARAAGVQAIDSVFGDVEDMDGLLAWGRRSRGLGFEGMGCIHPRQIRVIHEAFAPTEQEIEKALKIVTAFEDAQRRGLGVVSLGSRMIDPPVVIRAQRLVGLARRAGLIPANNEDESA